MGAIISSIGDLVNKGNTVGVTKKVLFDGIGRVIDTPSIINNTIIGNVKSLKTPETFQTYDYNSGNYYHSSENKGIYNGHIVRASSTYVYLYNLESRQETSYSVQNETLLNQLTYSPNNNQHGRLWGFRTNGYTNVEFIYSEFDLVTMTYSNKTLTGDFGWPNTSGTKPLNYFFDDATNKYYCLTSNSSDNSSTNNKLWLITFDLENLSYTWKLIENANYSGYFKFYGCGRGYLYYKSGSNSIVYNLLTKQSGFCTLYYPLQPCESGFYHRNAETGRTVYYTSYGTTTTKYMPYTIDSIASSRYLPVVGTNTFFKDYSASSVTTLTFYALTGNYTDIFNNTQNCTIIDLT